VAAVVNARNDPYLNGVYAPVSSERDAPDLPVTGQLPAGLAGMFLRNGPNPMFQPKGSYHIFDGDGMLHGLSLDGAGGASYRNRWVRTDGLAAEQRAGHAIYGGMANGDFPSPEETGGGPPIKNVANTNVVRHADRILCLWEAGSPTEVTAALETVGPMDFGGALTGAFTAHPKVDPMTGEMLAFGYSGFAPYLQYHVIDAHGSLVRTVDIDLPAPVMMHDFAITEQHAVFFDAPAVFDFESYAQGGPMLTWKPENGTRIGVVDRTGDGSDIVWVETDPCYVFHFMNAFTADGKVVVDACRLLRMDIGLDSADGTADANAWLHRFTIDLATRSASYEQIAELPGDFPRVPAAMEGRRHRFGYYASFSSGDVERGDFDAVTKVDFETGAALTHSYGPTSVAGEAVFAPDPSGTGGEDDGWLLNFVTDRTTMTSDFVVLAAADLSEVARVRLPQRVPFGFHGNWLPAS
jgi:carotenoid cleavage dioxygenase-like enzyme